MMFEYLRGRATLARVLLLVDSRIEFKESDFAVMELLDRAAVTYQFVLTKTDALKPAALSRKSDALMEIVRKHAAAYPTIHITSSETGAGIQPLRADLATLAMPSKASSS